MPARIAKGVITPRTRNVCPLCRPQSISPAQRQTRYQSTGPPANDRGHTNQETILQKLSNHNDSNPSKPVGDSIQATISNLDEKGKEYKGDSGHGSHESSRVAPRSIHYVLPQPKASPEVVQQKLQQKFAEQRRKDMLTMRGRQGLKAAEQTRDVFKAPPVPDVFKASPESESLKQSLQKRSSLAKKRKEERQKRIRALLATRERLKRKQAQLIDSAQTEAVRIATPTTHQSAKKYITKSVEASVGREQETLGAGDQKANENHSVGNVPASVGREQETSGARDKKANENHSVGDVPHKQQTIVQQLGDIMNIFGRLKNVKRSEKSVRRVKRAGEVKTGSTDIELQRVVKSVLKELQNSELSQDRNIRHAVAAIPHSSRQLPARIKPTSEETTQPSEILPKQSSGVDDLQGSPVAGKVIFEQEQSSEMDSRQVHRKYALKPRPQLAREAARVRHDSLTKEAQGATLHKAIGHIENAQTTSSPPRPPPKKTQKSRSSLKSPIETITASDLELGPVMVDQPPVPKLAYGLERVLFNPGVYQLQDPRSRVYNFDPYLQKIMPVTEFDFNALKEYITSSRDESLNKMAKEHGKRYMGSTSSMTAVLAHFHYLLSQWRPINPSMLSKAFPAVLDTFTEFQRIPAAIFLRWKNGSYAIDADKEFDNANVLSMLGKSMEKLLTLRTDDFERYRKSTPGQVTEDERFAPESYHYSTQGDFLMRSQLDAHDPRLPGTGMFDLKTRSVVSIRMDVENYEHGIGYEIKNHQGEYESYEREYYDMIRAAFLKYSMQVRMGRMDGIFVAFHNIERIFGFQYISLPEMDSTIHGQRDTSLGNQEFRLSLDLLNKILDRATAKYPETSLRIFFETREATTNFMYVFAEPVTEEQVAEIQSQNNAKIQEFERNVLGLTRGNDSETNDAPKVDAKWEEIQADVQKAMEADELTDDGSDQDQEAIDEGAEGTESNSNPPQVFSQGLLYASKSASGAGDSAITVSAGYEEDEGEDEDGIDGKDECENEEEEEENRKSGADNGNGEVEESRRQKGPEESLEEEAVVSATDASEAERNVDGDGGEENHIAPSENYPVKVQNTTNRITEYPNEDDTAGAISRPQSTNKTREATDDELDTRVSSDAEAMIFAEGEGQEEYQSGADHSFLNTIDEEVVETDTDLLAMTLTLRNKVNDEYVHRPVTMTANDEWSIEYSLTEISEPKRARALYHACQWRRRKKNEKSLFPEGEDIPAFVQNLRRLSRQGRIWRKKLDKMDEGQPVQVLSNSQEPPGT